MMCYENRTNPLASDTQIVLDSQQDSLAQYLASQLSRRIKRGELVGIEGRFLHGQHVRSLEYDLDGKVVKSSSGKADALSMFRLEDEGAC